MKKALVLALVLAALSSAPAPGRRIVAVGDIHGAFEAFRELLLKAELIDDDGRWVGGDAVLVQTGDFLDRGAGAIRVAHWLMELQKQAPKKGGEVVVLLGNHEVMNLIGDMRDVTAEMVAPLIDKTSKKRLTKMCRKRTSILLKGAKLLGQEAPSFSAIKDACLAEHPQGLVEYYETLRPDTPLGDWLRTRPVAVHIDGIVFVHGGIGPALAGRKLEDINRQLYDELTTFEEWRLWLVDNEWMVAAGSLVEMARAVSILVSLEDAGVDNGDAPDLRRFFGLSDDFLISPDGPLWFRGYTTWSDEEGLAEMPGILEALGARHVVSGHTPQKTGRIVSRFGDRVFLIDTGMLTEVYKGAPAALQFVDGRVEAIYLDKKVVLYEASAASTSATSSSTESPTAAASGSNS